jgi:hypothetical protein
MIRNHNTNPRFPAIFFFFLPTKPLFSASANKLLQEEENHTLFSFFDTLGIN